MRLPLSCLTTCLLAAFATPVLAQEAEESAWAVEGNVAAMTDFVWRGISQTDRGPALQGEIVISHTSGFYVGAWASNVDFAEPGDGINKEIDLYIGWAGELADGLELDLSATRAMYPGANEGYEADYTEVAAKLSFAEYYTLGVAYSPDIFQLGDKGLYYSATAQWPLGESDFGLKLGAGWYDLEAAAGDSYGDYLVGLTRNIGPLEAELHYTNTVSYGEALSENLDDASLAGSRLALLLRWSF